MSWRRGVRAAAASELRCPAAGNYGRSTTARQQMPELRFVGSAAELPEASSNTLLLGHRPALLAWIEATDALEGTVLPALAASLAPGTDSGASAETFIAAAEGAALRRVAVAMLPTACSRHNTPSHAHAVTKLVRSGAGGAAELSIVVALSDPAHASATACAVARAFPTYSLKSSAAAVPDVTVALVGANPSDLGRVNVAAAGVRRAMALVDAPTSELHTSAFVAEAAAVCAALKETAVGADVGITVIEGEQLQEAGLGGLWGVGKAASHPPALVVLSYTPAGATDSVAWVGKGIVYDTGGLSIKGKEGMPGMKTDMGGAAAVLAAFDSAVRSGPSEGIALHALLCLAENSIAAEATRPDDVHTFLSGKTVEVNNTDAEGRLVLGDGVAYAAKYLEPGLIIDLATLTGAQGIATGRNHAAIYCSTESIETRCLAAGRASGDLAHALPYVPEFYRSEFTSAVADMKNSVADRSNAQSSCAAQFIGAGTHLFCAPISH
jgi:probable aminopeptidase NPEPL1